MKIEFRPTGKCDYEVWINSVMIGLLVECHDGFYAFDPDESLLFQSDMKAILTEMERLNDTAPKS